MRVWGYILSLVGILTIVISSNDLRTKIPFINLLSLKALLVIGVICVFLGVFFLMQKQHNVPKHEKDEVPIYKGEGKDRVIIGYRKV